MPRLSDKLILCDISRPDRSVYNHLVLRFRPRLRSVRQTAERTGSHYYSGGGDGECNSEGGHV